MGNIFSKFKIRQQTPLVHPSVEVVVENSTTDFENKNQNEFIVVSNTGTPADGMGDTGINIDEDNSTSPTDTYESADARAGPRKENFIYFKNKSYALEKKLAHKLDQMLARVTQVNPKLDALLINEGGEGQGKSSASCAEAYYLKQKCGRDVHLFFRLEPLIDMAKSTENKILIWDEPSLDSLSTDQLKTINRDLLRLFMTVRKKRHFFIINLTKFWKFSEYVVVDRCLGMVHVYSRKEIEPGRFIYIKKKNLEQLWNGYAKGRERLYNKLKSFGGLFPDLMEKHFDEMGIHINGKLATFRDYEYEKDVAIFSIGEDKKKKDDINLIKLREFKFRISQLGKAEGTNKGEIARKLGVSETRLYEWARNNVDDDYLDNLKKIKIEKSSLPTTRSAINILVPEENEKTLDSFEKEDSEDERVVVIHKSEPLSNASTFQQVVVSDENARMIAAYKRKQETARRWRQTHKAYMVQKDREFRARRKLKEIEGRKELDAIEAKEELAAQVQSQSK